MCGAYPVLWVTPGSDKKSRFAKSNNVLLAWPDMTFLSLSVHYFNNRMEKVGYHAMK